MDKEIEDESIKNLFPDTIEDRDDDGGKILKLKYQMRFSSRNLAAGAS